MNTAQKYSEFVLGQISYDSDLADEHDTDRIALHNTRVRFSVRPGCDDHHDIGSFVYFDLTEFPFPSENNQLDVRSPHPSAFQCRVKICISRAWFFTTTLFSFTFPFPLVSCQKSHLSRVAILLWGVLLTERSRKWEPQNHQRCT